MTIQRGLSDITPHSGPLGWEVGIAIPSGNGYVVQTTHIIAQIPIPAPLVTEIEGDGHLVLPQTALRPVGGHIRNNPWRAHGMDWLRLQMVDRLGRLPPVAFVWFNHYDPAQPQTDPSE